VEHIQINKLKIMHKQNQEQNPQHHFNRYRKKNFDKIQYPFIIKALKKLGREGTFLNITKAVYDVPLVNIIRDGKKRKPFPLKSRIRQGCLHSLLLVNIVLEFLA
jgi:hypothetical protein